MQQQYPPPATYTQSYMLSSLPLFIMPRNLWNEIIKMTESYNLWIIYISRPTVFYHYLSIWLFSFLLSFKRSSKGRKVKIVKIILHDSPQNQQTTLHRKPYFSTSNNIKSTTIQNIPLILVTECMKKCRPKQNCAL